MIETKLYKYKWKFARVTAIAALFAIAKMTQAQTATTPPSGQKLFSQQCATCHSVVKGDGDRAGPSLYAVVGRTAGKLPGFEYSPALKRSAMKWNPVTLDRWLSDSNAAVPGSYMNYKQADAAKRRAIIAYLSGNS